MRYRWSTWCGAAVTALVAGAADAATEVRVVVAEYSAATAGIFQGMERSR